MIDPEIDLTANVGIVVSDYYQNISNGLLAGALQVINEHPEINYEVARVLGVWELPVIAKVMVQSRRFEGIIALGCVIRGETSHFNYICQQSSKAIMDISIEHAIPIGFGVLTVENIEQAKARSGISEMKKNKGVEAAAAVIGSLHAVAQLRQDY